MVEEEHDGVAVTKSGDGTHAHFDLRRALEQENPRNIFLNGQLHLESTCDDLISAYLANKDSLRMGVIHSFLTSRHMTFFAKIKLLKGFVVKNEKGNKVKMIDPKVIKSLEVIGDVRNAFQHNLVYDNAIGRLKKNDKKFALTGINVKECKDVAGLVLIFKTEAIRVNGYLHKILHKYGFDDLTFE